MIVKPNEVLISVQPTTDEHALLEHAAMLLIDYDDTGRVELVNHARDIYLRYINILPMVREHDSTLTMNEFSIIGLAASLDYIVEKKHCAGKEIRLAKIVAARLRRSALISTIVQTDDSLRNWMRGLEDQLDMQSLGL